MDKATLEARIKKAILYFSEEVRLSQMNNADIMRFKWVFLRLLRQYFFGEDFAQGDLYEQAKAIFSEPASSQDTAEASR